jgi:hypothetical protein
MPAPLTPVKILEGIMARLTRIEQRLNNVLAHTGLSVPAQGVVQCDGNFHVATGNLLVDGSTTINGPLVLPNASVNNAWLASPVSGGANNPSVNGFALSTTLVELAGVDITVPDGFSQVVGVIGAFVFAYDPNTTGGSNGTGGDAIYAQARLGATQSRANPLGVSGNGGFTTSSSAVGYTLSGLTGGSTIRLSVYGSAAYQAIAYNASNYANAYASFTWLR